MDLVGIAAIITAVGGLAYQNRRQTKKLDTITVLVDGRYGKVLEELSEVKAVVYGLTGLKVDKERAVSAKKLSDDHITLEGTRK